MGRKGVTWVAVRLLSHGSCFQAEQSRGRSFGVAVRSEGPALDFHVAPSTSGREAPKRQRPWDGDSSHQPEGESVPLSSRKDFCSRCSMLTGSPWLERLIKGKK